MESGLSPQDKKDLDKFIKFFALKTFQVIVQARLGEKICTTSSSSPTGSDWFNLAIKDIPEVTHEAKKALAGQLPGIGRSMCVEISLKTSEGDSMELETWCLEMNEKCDKDIKVSYTVYNRLSVLLKSLLAITRVTPAYKLSRKQGHDYVILYRIYFGEVQLSGLGEGNERFFCLFVCFFFVQLLCSARCLLQAFRQSASVLSVPRWARSRCRVLTAPIWRSCPTDNLSVRLPSWGLLWITLWTPPVAASGQAPEEEDRGTFAGVQDSQEVCTTSFSTSPPSQVGYTPLLATASPRVGLLFSFRPFHPSFHFLTMFFCCLYLLLPQCVCTLSPSPSKQSKPTPSDSLQLPLAPGFVTHTLYSSRLLYQPPGAPGTSEPCQPAANPNQMLCAGKEGGAALVPAQPSHGADAHFENAPNTPGSSGEEDGLTQSGDGKREDGRRSASPTDPVHSLSAITRKTGAFVNKPSTQTTTANLDLPFSAFASRDLDSEDNDPMVQPPNSPPCTSPLLTSLHSQGSEGSGPHDDFVMVDFRPAFSKDDLLPMDLGTFYREFQNPPQLASLTLDISSQSMADDLDSLPEKLAVYEKNIDEFDAFVDTLQ
ncbi:unnamed protein product [Tetraodon nigroviridis]|uniref:Autophagy-related protein 13 n=1 Tax=Tetraodon nigroviridis TaxID=99883 RepID=Q4T4V4_TETNG|nr:unnamed protein product [Tetraodon nigroviridis]